MGDKAGSDLESYSRVFVLCSKTYSKEDLKSAFSACGEVKDVYSVRDKVTGENKGTTLTRN